ncbi:MAG: FmdB family zinc ribbon protein [Candidatus Dormibacteria bacterium]
MPTYAYRCDAGHQFETVQGITDPPLSACRTCGSPVRRVVFPVGVVFKGQGFYKTDSRSASGATPSGGGSTKEKAADKAENGNGKAAAKGGDPAPAATPKSESASSGAAAGGTP